MSTYVADAGDEDDCPHGLGDPAWCQLCNGALARERRAELYAKEHPKRVPFWLFKKGRPFEGGRITGAQGTDRRAFDHHGLLFENDEGKMPKRLPR